MKTYEEKMNQEACKNARILMKNIETGKPVQSESLDDVLDRFRQRLQEFKEKEGIV